MLERLKQQGWVKHAWAPFENQERGLARASERFGRDPHAPLLIHWIMGAGKTDYFFLLIALLSGEHGHRTALIVAPALVLGEMVSKAERFFGERVTVHMHAGADRERRLAEARLYCRDTLLVLSTIGSLPAEKVWDTVVLDEAHLYRSDKQVGMIAKLQHKVIIESTGTPWVTSERDLITLLRHTKRQPYCDPDYWKERGTQELAAVVAEMSDQINEVPRTYRVERHTVAVPMSAEQRAQEDVIFGDRKVKLGGFVRGLEAKLNALSAGLAAGRADWAEQPAPKTLALLEQLRLYAPQKVVVVCESVVYLHMLSRLLGAPCIDHSVSKQARKQIVQDFESAGRVLLLSKRLAVGLNLSSASVIVLMDASYTFAEESQAEHRVLRADQKNTVHLVRLVATRSDGVLSVDQRCLYNQLSHGVNADRALGTLHAQNPRFAELPPLE